MTDVSTVSEDAMYDEPGEFTPAPSAVQQTSDLRARIFAVDDIPVEEVLVPEWGDLLIEVRGMTGGDRAAMMAEAAESGSIDFTVMYADIIVKTCYDPATGLPIFTEADRGAINGKSGKVVDRLAEVGMRLSGMSGSSTDDAGKSS